MRDRLVELIKQANKKCASTDKCEDCSACDTGDEPDDCLKYNIADHLLSNGVIAPTCKVGDTVYSFIQGIPVIYEGHVYEIIYNGHVCVYRGTRKGYFTQAFSEDDIGKTVFFTREEAEQALKGEHQ